MTDGGEITKALDMARAGDELAMGRLWDLVYVDLKSMAIASMQHEPYTAGLSPTGLVHEAYMKLCPEAGPPPVSSTGDFLAWSRTVMRSILIDAARRRKALKRGAGVRPGSLVMDVGGLERVLHEDVSIDCLLDQLHQLQDIDQDAHEVIWCRFGMGMSIRRTAEAIGRSESWVERKWEWGRRWLHRNLRSVGNDHEC